MTLVGKTYGKGRVRVMRIHRDGERYEVRELTVMAMLQGDFARAFTDRDNSTSISTDTVKNVVNVVARENLALPTEQFLQAVAQRLLDGYSQVEKTVVSGHESPWLAFRIPTASRSMATANLSPRWWRRATPSRRFRASTVSPS